MGSRVTEGLVAVGISARSGELLQGHRCKRGRGLGCEAGWVSRGVVRACWELGPHRMWGRDLPACVARGPGGAAVWGNHLVLRSPHFPLPREGRTIPGHTPRLLAPPCPPAPRPLLPVISSQHGCYRDLSSKDLPGPSASVGDHVLFPRQAPSCLVPCTQCLQWNSLPSFTPEAATSGFLGFRGQGPVCATPLCPQHPFVTAQFTLT